MYKTFPKDTLQASIDCLEPVGYKVWTQQNKFGTTFVSGIVARDLYKDTNVLSVPGNSSKGKCKTLLPSPKNGNLQAWLDEKLKAL